MICPAENANEAAVVSGLDVIPVHFLGDAVGFLTDELPVLSAAEGPVDPAHVDLDEVLATETRYDVDFSDVRGQESAKRALTIAAACREPAERRGTTIPMDIGNRPPGVGQDRVRRLISRPTIRPLCKST